MAGESIPALHTWNIDATYYVDAVNGNDTTGTGSSGAPWQTLQKAHNELRDNITWPTNDVKLALRTGTYKSTTADITMDINFTNAARAPSSSRYLIITPDVGHEGLVKVCNPSGTNAAKGTFRLGSGSLNSYIIWQGLEFDGENEAKGPAAGNGNSYAIYAQSTTANNNRGCEVVGCWVHGYVGSSGAAAPAQGISNDDGASEWKYYYNRIGELGTPSGVGDLLEHGLYLQSPNNVIVGNLFYKMLNGYGVQFFAGTTMTGALIACNTFDDNEASGLTINPTHTNCTIKNNIFSNHTRRAGTESYGIEYYPTTGSTTGAVVDRNHYYNNDAGNRSQSPGGWTFTNESSGDPLYTDRTNNDYRLAEGSPCIGIGDDAYRPPKSISNVNGVPILVDRTTTDQGAYMAAAAYGPPPQIILPDADIATTGWATAPLFSKINDASDATVITGTLV